MDPVNPDPKVRKGEDVRKMFSAIAPKYDLLNHLLSLNVDKGWRKKAVEALGPQDGGTYLDVCTGTGDFAFELLKLRGTRVAGVDFSIGMLKYAEAKKNDLTDVSFAAGDALCLPFKDDCFDGGMVAFGIRNFEDLEKGLKEINRVLKGGAKFAILEFPHRVGGVFGPLFNLYFRVVLPMLGRMISKDSFAYNYLPESTKHFPPEAELKELFGKCGFEIVSFKKRTIGIVFEAVLKKY